MATHSSVLPEESLWTEEPGEFSPWNCKESDMTVWLSTACIPNIGGFQNTRQMLTAIKWEINSNTIILGDFNTSLYSKDRSFRQKNQLK